MGLGFRAQTLISATYYHNGVSLGKLCNHFEVDSDFPHLQDSDNNSA